MDAYPTPEKIDANSQQFGIVCKFPGTVAQMYPQLDVQAAEDDLDQFSNALSEAFCSVYVLDPDLASTASCDMMKVGDTAVIINGTALMCNPSGTHRQKEITAIRKFLKSNAPGIKVCEMTVNSSILEGSDVLFTGKEIIVGLSAHTNDEGAQCVAEVFPDYPVAVVKVPPATKAGVGGGSLKDHLCMVGDNCIAIAEESKSLFNAISNAATYNYAYLSLPDKDAVNSLYVNGMLIHPVERLIQNSFGIFTNKIVYNRKPIEMGELCRNNLSLSKMVLLFNNPYLQRHIMSTLA